MKILFDQGTPVPLRRHLPGPTIDTVYERGWATLSNGELLRVAEQAAYDLLITTDQNLNYQQNLASRQIAIVVLQSTSWPLIQNHLDAVKAAVQASTNGSYFEVQIALPN